MSDWFFRQGGRDRLINWLGIDAWLDSKIAETWGRIKDRYNAASSWFARFRLTGWKRILNELASEALTLGAAGIAVLYILGIPAFREMEDGRGLAMGQFSVTFLDQNGLEIGKRGINLNDAVPLEEIPDHMIQAALATEDRRFFEHYGVDVLGTLRALVENVRANDVVQGGSTLTQQLAKNLFLSSERSIQRKIKEAFLSLWLESRLTKREILKLYLDRAYMGGGAFGVEAAAQFYFGKSVRDVTLAEAAMMAGLFKAPTKYAPHIDLAAARARANEVLSNLVEAGFYTSGQVYEARLNPAVPVETQQGQSPDWFLDLAYDEIQRVMKGKGQYVLTARTTIDQGLQTSAEQALESTLSQYGRENNATAGALVALEPDGAVRAIVGGRDYGESQFNRATSARRQPGSSFKVYVYATALENGMTSRTRLRDSSVTCGRWSPKNYNGSYGSGRSVTMADALRVSLNTTAVAVSLDVGRDKVIEFTKSLGIDGVRRSCSMALGDTGITPLEHTAGYAAFANGGYKATPYTILEVMNSRGEVVYSREKDAPPRERVMSESTAEQMNQMMQGVVEDGTGKAAQLDFTHSVGKTGTSSSYRDAWFMGFTGKYVTGVWIGNDDYRPMYRRGGRGGVTGGSLPAQTWKNFMQVAHRSLDMPTVPGLEPHPVQIEERRRIAELQQADPTLRREAGENRQATASGLLPATRDALGELSASLKKARGGGKPEGPGGTGGSDKDKRDQRADAGRLIPAARTGAAALGRQ